MTKKICNGNVNGNFGNLEIDSVSNPSTTVMPTSDPTNRAVYFVDHVLPWVISVFALAGVCVLFYHYRNKTCFWHEKIEEEDRTYNEF